MTNREIISDIRKANKFMEYDTMVSDRFLLSLAFKYSLLLIQRETNKRKLWNLSNAFHTINCFKLEQVPLSQCLDFTSSEIISKSVDKLPNVENGYYGNLIQGVYDIEGRVEIKATSLKQYQNYLKLNKFRSLKKEAFYFIEEGYLYITHPSIEAVKIVALFSEYDVNLSKYKQCDCDCCDDDDCYAPLDEEFKCPGYLTSSVLEMVNNQLRVYAQLREDKTDNGDADTQ